MTYINYILSYYDIYKYIVSLLIKKIILNHKIIESKNLKKHQHFQKNKFYKIKFFFNLIA